MYKIYICQENIVDFRFILKYDIKQHFLYYVSQLLIPYFLLNISYKNV